ncbi:MAG: ferredoxin family protein [Actinobacteria bacterium]|nr:ferredoxin family protein [Actinomycetota bacterium]
MAYVIAEPCIGTKDTSCVDVCPVDCIHPAPGDENYETSTMLYIDPAECIDCDACVEACPVDATLSEDDVPAQWDAFKEINRAYFEQGLDAAEKMLRGYLDAKA